MLKHNNSWMQLLLEKKVLEKSQWEEKDQKNFKLKYPTLHSKTTVHN